PLGEMEGAPLRVFVVDVRDLERCLEGVAHLHAEPLIEGGVDIERGDEEKHHRGHDGQSEEAQNQLGFELGAEQALSPLEEKLREVPEDEENQHREQDQVEVDDPEKE